VKSRDPSSVEDRLRQALTAPGRGRREGVDMSADAITARLVDLAELSRLCLELAAIAKPPQK
jgi:hypothetical protein